MAAGTGRYQLAIDHSSSGWVCSLESLFAEFMYSPGVSLSLGRSTQQWRFVETFRSLGPLGVRRTHKAIPHSIARPTVAQHMSSDTFLFRRRHEGELRPVIQGHVARTA